MRSRYMGYSDYGLTADEVRSIKELCDNIECGSEEDVLLRSCCHEVNPNIENALYISLKKGISYDEMSKRDYIPIYKNDFYGYRRRVMARFLSLYLDRYVESL